MLSWQQRVSDTWKQWQRRAGPKWEKRRTEGGISQLQERYICKSYHKGWSCDHAVVLALLFIVYGDARIIFPTTVVSFFSGTLGHSL